MVENRIISFTDIGYVLGTCPKKLHRWYKEVLSGFTQAKESGEIHKHDVQVKGSAKSIRVPIFIEENIGKELCIDEKHINGRYYTILSNMVTNKIILIIKGTRADEVYKVISTHLTPEQMMAVKVITKDAANNFDWAARQAFPNALKVLDKFHILLWVFDALQTFRNELKTQHTLQAIKEQEVLTAQYNLAVKKAKKSGAKVLKRNYQYIEPTHKNGETTKQLIARSKYILYKVPDEYNDEQEQRAQILFDLYPKLFDAYTLALSFREWYSKDNVGKEMQMLEFDLLNWLEKCKTIKSDSFKVLTSAISRHRGQILNYFIAGHTNASAEALNRNIQKFIGVNYGIRNTDFFYYRLSILHSGTSI